MEIFLIFLEKSKGWEIRRNIWNNVGPGLAGRREEEGRGSRAKRERERMERERTRNESSEKWEAVRGSEHASEVERRRKEGAVRV